MIISNELKRQHNGKTMVCDSVVDFESDYDVEGIVKGEKFNGIVDYELVKDVLLKEDELGLDEDDCVERRRCSCGIVRDDIFYVALEDMHDSIVKCEVWRDKRPYEFWEEEVK